MITFHDGHAGIAEADGWVGTRSIVHDILQLLAKTTNKYQS